MVKVSNIFLMETLTKVNMLMDFLKDSEFIFGMMEANMKEILNRV